MRNPDKFQVGRLADVEGGEEGGVVCFKFSPITKTFDLLVIRLTANPAMGRCCYGRGAGGEKEGVARGHLSCN